MSLIYCVSSGKGGVGKTLSSVHFAVSLQKTGKSVLIVDGDVGLSNVDVVMGITPRYNIIDVLNGSIEAWDALEDGPLGIKILHGGSGLSQISSLTETDKLMAISHIKSLAEHFDVTIIDAGAGISQTVLEMNRLADLNVVVTTPEAHAMTDAYALVKVLKETKSAKTISILVNQARTADEGENAYLRIAGVAEKFLGVRPSFLGSVPSDPQVSALLRRRNNGASFSLQTLAGSAWARISHKFSEAVADSSHRLSSNSLGTRLDF